MLCNRAATLKDSVNGARGSRMWICKKRKARMAARKLCCPGGRPFELSCWSDGAHRAAIPSRSDDVEASPHSLERAHEDSDAALPEIHDDGDRSPQRPSLV